MFSMREAFGYGWRALWAQPWQVHLGWCLVAALNEALYYRFDQLPESAFGTALLGELGCLLVTLLLGYGFLLQALDRRFGRKRSWRELLAEWPQVRVYTQLCLVAALVIVPAMLLVVPGVWLVAAYGPALWVALDQGTPFGETLTRTAALTRGARYSLFWLSLLLSLPSLAGVGLEMALGPLGYLLQVPLQAFAMAWATHAYTDAYACLKARNRLPELA